MPDIRPADTPPLGSTLNDANRTVGGVEKLSAESRNSPLVKLRRPNEFRFGGGW